ncbi:hypothetical protein [Sphingobacterium griseoflavum]|uniref:hypothetical protein n=1 Tax=Sphingobacterium griseoflavum TaxID=1474952 RepID=UPI001672C6AA|nr:hypothetical protein [Sphingobacterium griseoflavum]
MEAVELKNVVKRKASVSHRIAQQKKYFKIGILSSVAVVSLLVIYYLYAPSSFLFLLGFIFIFNLLSVLGLIYYIRIFLRER